MAGLWKFVDADVGVVVVDRGFRMEVARSFGKEEAGYFVESLFRANEDKDAVAFEKTAIRQLLYCGCVGGVESVRNIMSFTQSSFGQSN